VSWKVPLPGTGVSTPIVWQEKIYLTTPSAAEGEIEDAVMGLDKNGKQLWMTKLGKASPARHRTLASTCNASPVTDGKGIFARFRSGRVAALEMDGKLRWQWDLHEKFGPEELYWDQGASPAVVDDLLIISRMHHGESWVGAFDKQTGEQRWLQKRNYEVPAENDNGYTTPIVFNYKGRKALLVWGSDHLTAHSVKDGSMLWSCGDFNPGGMKNWPAIASPVIHDGMAIVPVGRDDRPNQAKLHGIKMDGEGDVTGTHRAWSRDDVGVFCSTPVEYKGKVYLLRHRGGVVCVDPATGKTEWAEAFPRGTGSFYSSPVIANGILYAAREDGVVFAAKIDGKFEQLSENAMGERVVASPVPANNGILIRGDKNLIFIAAK
jgi:outer membrane protein assembly factor BamB